MRTFFTGLLFFVLILLNTATLSAQVVGQGVYQFLNLTASARAAATGGNFMAVNDGDLSLALFNPSLINPQMNHKLSMSFVDYYADVNYGFASYANTFEKIGSYAGSVQYISYGDFIYADATGQTGGKFKASELALILGWGRKLDSAFSIGANLKFIHSGLESYKSYGMAVDVSGSYLNDEHQLAVSLVARNIGTQIKPFVSGTYESLPFELHLGVSQKLRHVPFRYSVLITNLHQWDLTDGKSSNNTGKIDPITGKPIKEDPFSSFLDKAMRHVVVGGEFYPVKPLTIRLGYNYHRRQELGVNTRMSTVGFSWGFGLRINRFQIDYSRATYHLAGSPNYLTISTRLSDFF